MDTKEALDILMDSMVTMAAESDQVCFLKYQGIKLFISFFFCLQKTIMGLRSNRVRRVRPQLTIRDQPINMNTTIKLDYVHDKFQFNYKVAFLFDKVVLDTSQIMKYSPS